MSVIIRIPGADFSESGLPKLQREIHGILADNLVGLYLMEDGTNGQAVTTLTDSSGNGNHAELYAGTTAATKQSYGLETAGIIGSAYNTGITQTAEFTVIACLKHKVAEVDYAGYPTFFTDTAGGFSSGHGQRLALNIALSGGGINTVGTYDASDVILGTGRRLIPSSKQISSEPFVVALGVSKQEGVAKLQSVTGYNFTATGKSAEIATKYDNLTSKMLIGIWPHGADAPIAGEVYAYAIYDKLLSDVEIAQAMTAIKARVQLRGVTF